MNKQDLIKYAALAVGAYLIYKYVFADGGLFGSTPGQLPAGNGTQPPAPPPGPSGQPADTMPPATTAPPYQPPPPPSTSTMERIPDETLHRQKLASNFDYAKAHGAGLKLSADQWNYYRQQIGGAIRDAGELADRGQLMTAPQYIGWLTGTTLSGLSHPMASGYGISDFTWLM